jgi:hypothetical protein
MTNEPRGTLTPTDVFEAVRTLLAVRSYKVEVAAELSHAAGDAVRLSRVRNTTSTRESS